MVLNNWKFILCLNNKQQKVSRVKERAPGNTAQDELHGGEEGPCVGWRHGLEVWKKRRLLLCITWPQSPVLSGVGECGKHDTGAEKRRQKAGVEKSSREQQKQQGLERRATDAPRGSVIS